MTETNNTMKIIKDNIMTHRERCETDAAKRFKKLTPHEQALVKEAAVMGFFLGRIAHKDPFPRDSVILLETLITVKGYPDLYPTLAEFTPEVVAPENEV